MELLQVLPEPPRELFQVSQQRVPEKANEPVDERSSVQRMRAHSQKALQQDASPGFPESHPAPPVSPQQEARPFLARLKALPLTA